MTTPTAHHCDCHHTPPRPGAGLLRTAAAAATAATLTTTLAIATATAGAPAWAWPLALAAAVLAVLAGAAGLLAWALRISAAALGERLRPLTAAVKGLGYATARHLHTMGPISTPDSTPEADQTLEVSDDALRAFFFGYYDGPSAGN